MCTTVTAVALCRSRQTVFLVLVGSVYGETRQRCGVRVMHVCIWFKSLAEKALPLCVLRDERPVRESRQIMVTYVCPNTKRRTKKSVRLGSGLVLELTNLSLGHCITSALATGQATAAVTSGRASCASVSSEGGAALFLRTRFAATAGPSDSAAAAGARTDRRRCRGPTTCWHVCGPW